MPGNACLETYEYRMPFVGPKRKPGPAHRFPVLSGGWEHDVLRDILKVRIQKRIAWEA